MTISRFRVPVLLAAFILVPALNCGSVTPSPDGGGAAGAGTAGAAEDGTAGATGGSMGQAGVAGEGHDGGAAGGGGASGNGGSAGSGHDGGNAGGGGQGGSGASCSDLQNQYGAAFADAQMCTVGASGQCAQLASAELSPCGFGCTYYVDDTTTLNTIKAEWQAAGCDSLVGVECPAIGYVCTTPRVGTCLAADGGGGKCVTTAGVITTGAQPAN
jgi:hypothetical protein